MRDAEEDSRIIRKYNDDEDVERDGTLGEVIDRRVQVYGDPVTAFAEIATMWSVLFDVEVPAWKVPIAQALMKVVRMKNSPDYSDHSDDIDGYLDIFRKIIGPDMISARTVNEYIEKKWPLHVVDIPTPVTDTIVQLMDEDDKAPYSVATSDPEWDRAWEEVISRVADWSDEEFEQAFGFKRPEKP